MKLTSVYIRFYKSFNYDYRRKIATDINPKPWEYAGEHFYPHVEIPIDSLITTIVGANESGKSHLLSAIEKGITGVSKSGGSEEGIERKDFCRYSQFFQSTKEGTPRYPDIGFQWSDLAVEEKQKVLRACKLEEGHAFSRFFFFRTHEKSLVYLPEDQGGDFDGPFDVTGKEDDLLPPVFRIDSTIALPDRIAIQQLIEGRMDEDAEWKPFDRERAFLFAETASELDALLEEISSASTAAQGTLALSSVTRDKAKKLKKKLAVKTTALRSEERRKEIKAFNLAYDLIFKIAGIEREDIEMLREALSKGQTGVKRSILEKINHALAVKLRFPRVWSQDRNFALRVEATEHELSFIINDRTGSQYSFDERSSGLKHFLSYYIQYLAHEPVLGASFEVLLMDEPDAFLSGEAQQDLLKIFQMFADPLQGKGEGAIPTQVIYVTHSPFLIDKNHAERVRALEKPEGPKGTRVVKSAAQNRYEPLRSAFGPFVGETAFISHCNLMVEGLADQILLAGATSYLRRLQVIGVTEMLDLNHITIVPAGGADNIPYLAYLARGRDPEKPAVIALLDSDAEGDRAKQKLGKNGPHPDRRQVLDPKFILQLGDIAAREVPGREAEGDVKPFKVLEDLIPLPLAIRAAKEFARSIYDLHDDALTGLNETAVLARTRPDVSTFDIIREVFSELDTSRQMDIDKVPFARTVVDMLPSLARERKENDGVGPDGLDEFEANMRSLFRRLHAMQLAAEGDVKDKRMRQKVEEKIATFLSDFEETRAATRDDVSSLLSNIESDLEGDEGERGYIVQQVAKIRELHNLGEDPTERVNDFDELLTGLERLRNAKDFVAAQIDTDIPSLKKVRASTEAAHTEHVPAAALDDKETPPDLESSPVEMASEGNVEET